MNTKQLISCLLLGVIFLFTISCKKELSNTDNTFNEADRSINWLLNQNTNSNVSRKEKIEALVKNLEIRNYWKESNSNNNYLIIPVKKTFKFINNDKENVSNYLVFVLRDTIILENFILQYKPLENSLSQEIPNGIISSVGTNKSISKSCALRYLDVCDNYKYELTYKNGNLEKAEYLKKKQKGNEPINNFIQATSSSSEECTAWYLNTTTYYSDGHSETSSEYLGTTCTYFCGIANPGTNISFICDETGALGGGAPATDQAVLEGLISEFNQYTNTRIPYQNITSPIAPLDPNLNTFPFSWIVGSHVFDSWQINASGTCSFYKTLFYNIQTNATQYDFNITDYKTLGVAFIGSEAVVASTWTLTGTPVDVIYNNNTNLAYAKSTITGTIHHKYKTPLSGSILALFSATGAAAAITTMSMCETTNNVSNSCTYTPR